MSPNWSAALTWGPEKVGGYDMVKWEALSSPDNKLICKSCDERGVRKQGREGEKRVGRGYFVKP
jgi:hypothetical protein